MQCNVPENATSKILSYYYAAMKHSIAAPNVKLLTNNKVFPDKIFPGPFPTFAQFPDSCEIP